MQVGVGTTQKLTKSQLTIMCKLGIGPTKRISSQFLQTIQVSEANTEAVTNDKILLHNKSLVVLYHYCLPFLIVMMHNNLSSNCRIKLYLISNYPELLILQLWQIFKIIIISSLFINLYLNFILYRVRLGL